MLHAVLLIAGLVGSNIFMTFAWYAHLRDLSAKPWYLAALVSWGIALFEYLLQVPANRAGHQVFTISQLKLIQEVISLSVFIPIAILYLNERPSWNYLWAGLCLLGAVYFVFRSPRPSREATPQVTALGTEVSDSRVETPTAMTGSSPPTRSDHGPPL